MIKMNTRKLSLLGLLLVIITAVVLMSGCTQKSVESSTQHAGKSKYINKIEEDYKKNYTCFKDSFNSAAKGFKILKKLTVNGKEFPGVILYNISYKSDGHTIYGLLMRPKREGKFPLVVYNHGGTSGIPESSLRWNFDLAKEGYVVVMSAYRGERLINDNMKTIVVDTENLKSQGRIDPYEVHDVLNLMECAKTLDYVDDSKIAMYGSSHGGLLTLLALERTDEIDVAAYFYGYDILRSYLSYLNNPSKASFNIFTTEFRKMSQEKQLEYVNKLDPMLCIDKINTPLLVVVGDKDAGEIYEGALEVIEKLKKYNKEFSYKIYKNEGHSFNFYTVPAQKNGNKADAYNRMVNFFQKYLSDSAESSAQPATPDPIAKEELSFIGVDPHSYSFPMKDFYYLDKFGDIGINFYGLNVFGWNGIQPEERGPYEWEKFDSQVKIIEGNGGEILFTIWSGSKWASTVYPVRGLKGNRVLPSSPIKEKYIEDFKKFVKDVVERYDGDGIDDMPGLKKPHLFYQFEGEPDSFFPKCDSIKQRLHCHWCGTPEEYNYLVKVFYDAVKEANPNAVVLSPSTMFNDIFDRNFDDNEFNQIVNDKNQTDSYKRYRFIKTLLSEPDNFDVVAIQGNKNYEGNLPWVKWIREQVPDKDIWFADAAAGYIYNKHVYSHEKYDNEDKIEEALRNGDINIVKELGFRDYNELLDWALAEQSKNVFKKIVVAADAGVKHIFLQWPFESEDPIKGWVNVGLLEDDIPKSKYPVGTPRPAFYSTKQFIEKIGNFDSVTDLNPLPKGVDPIDWTWIVKFKKGDRVVFVLWSDSGSTTVDLSSHLSTPYAKITHIVTELDENNNPIYPPDEVVPADSILIDGTPRLVEGFEKEVTQTVIILKIGNPYMTVNGVQKEIDPGRGTKPVIIPKWSRTVVPIRAIVEALGGTINWDGTERKVTMKLNGTTIELWIDKPQAKVNGAMKWIDSKNHNVKPIIVNDRTMLPLRFVAESLGCTVGWNGTTKTITITYGE